MDIDLKKKKKRRAMPCFSLTLYLQKEYRKNTLLSRCFSFTLFTASSHPPLFRPRTKFPPSKVPYKTVLNSTDLMMMIIARSLKKFRHEKKKKDWIKRQ